MVRIKGYPKFILKRFRATVINDIWPELVFFTLVATMVCLVSKLRHPLGISPQMLTVLGTVLGLVVSFRTSSAYDRYWEGRKLWSNIALASRQLGQIIWLHVADDRPHKNQPDMSNEDAMIRCQLEKRTMINLVQAFSVSMKHFLRGEEGVYYEDLYPLIAFLPRYINDPSNPNSARPSESGDKAGAVAGAGTGTVTEKPQIEGNQFPLWYHSGVPPKVKKIKRAKTFDPEKVLPKIQSDIPLRPARNPPPMSIWSVFPILLPLRWLAKLVSKRVRDAVAAAGDDRTISGKVRKPAKVESKAPLEITLYLSSYLAFLLRNGYLQAAIATAYANQLQLLQDCTTSLERVRNTPIPFAYQVHLRMSIWLYLLFLPFEVYGAFGYLTIPGTLFASFLILGFLEIGQEIENPFGYEDNDLDLDGFCLGIQRELHEITAHAAFDPKDFIFNPSNQPLAPVDRTGADDLLNNRRYHGREGTDTLRRTLLHNWHEVNETTRDTGY